MKRIAFSLFVFTLLVCLLVGCTEFDGEIFDITLNTSLEDIKKLPTTEAEQLFREMGFTLFTYKTTSIGATEENNGKISNVKIQTWFLDSGSFKEGGTYQSNATVVIETYKYTAPVKPSASYHSSDDRDIAKKGNTGVYAYQSDGREYDIYWIIDFDAGYVYRLTEGNGNEECDRVKIVSGDLNDVLIITYHDGNTKWNYGLHFNIKNQPNHLIMQDNNGFEYDFYTTDLSYALKLRDSKTIVDY